ncbi:MAG: trypsin-like peptidase domain-containing protein [Pseudomonadota bacterium]
MRTLSCLFPRWASFAYCLLAAAPGQAQPSGRIFPYQWASAFPAEQITMADLQTALIWTGHYNGMADGKASPLMREAVMAWQSSHARSATGTLTRDESIRLVTEGLSRRDAVGWATLADAAIGYSIGVPTRLTELQQPELKNGTWWVRTRGTYNLSLMARPFPRGCSAMAGDYERYLGMAAADRTVQFKARADDWYVVAGERGNSRFHTRAQCRDEGIVTAIANVPATQAGSLGRLFAAMTNSLSLAAALKPNAKPAPRIDPLPYAPGASATAGISGPEPRLPSSPPPPEPPPSGGIDASGKTGAIRLVRRGGAALPAEEVFERVAGAVFVVRAARSQGSAVAISPRELLTNCHVVGTSTTVTLEREGRRLPASVIAANPAGDRCVLRIPDGTPPLARWVRVRPWDDIKVGEPVFTVGAPRGMELTLADGVVSSKRNADEGRVVQTSAPISNGSSGGGLFDGQGHLIGITTFMIKNAQNLNFAIAAEEYAR